MHGSPPRTKPARSPSAVRVQVALGPNFRVVELDASTRTSAEAAAAIGCEVEEIAKSLIFRAATTGRSVLVIASGKNRIDERKVEALLGEKIKRADAEFVREKTGFAIGGVPPVGHAVAPVVLVDEGLLAYEVIWAAAGTPNAVFKLTPANLLKLTNGRVAAITAKIHSPTASL